MHDFKLKFNFYALALFFIIMLPNIIWFIFPAANDVLRNTSITPKTDLAASIFQALAVILLCTAPQKICKYSIITLVFCVLYYICWALYYFGFTALAVLLGLCLFPCLALIFYERKTKNYAALIPTCIFLILHLCGCIINFL